MATPIVGGRRGRIGATLMRHAYLDMFKRYGNNPTLFFYLFYFFPKEEKDTVQVVRVFFSYRNERSTDAKRGRKKIFIRPEPIAPTYKHRRKRRRLFFPLIQVPNTGGQISSAAWNKSTF